MADQHPGSEAALDRIAELEAEVRRLRAVLAGADDGEAAEVPAGPIFVGGTGRSGTWVVGRLLGRHPSIVTIRTELRFHASEDGFRRVLSGEETAEEYAERVRTRWFTISGPGGRPKGPFLLATKEELKQATSALLALSDLDLRRGLETFCRTLIDPFALGRGATTWVETTPDNAIAADSLLTVFPDARLVHMVRDGRDVAASVVSMPWGPESFGDALDWWHDRMVAAHRASLRADQERLLVLRLEELIHLDRQRTFHELMDLAGIADRRPIEQYFDRQMDASRAHVGRWRTDVSRRDAKRIDARYRELWQDLADQGAGALPVHPDVSDDLASGGSTAQG